MFALEGWAQFSGWKLTLTGEMGGWRSRGDCDRGTVGSGLVPASLHSDRVGERPCMGTGFLCIGLETGEAVGGAGVLVTAAMACEDWPRKLAGLGDVESPKVAQQPGRGGR